MSRIRRLAPTVCAECGAHNTLFVAADRRLTCRQCGHRVGLSDDAPPQPTPPHDPIAELKRKYQITYGITHHGEIDAWARSAYNTGLAAIQTNRVDEAVAAFRRALDSERDFVDAHLWLARLLPGAEEKRHHYGEVIAQMPNHMEAIRELMVLRGDLSAADGDRARRGDGRVMTAEVPVEALTVDQECPVCGGEMKTQRDGSSLCTHCGYARKPRQGEYGMKSMAMEMLRRRGQKERWEVGERLLRCKNCNAETLLQPQTLTVRCPFCGSRGVVEADALRSFVRPDSILLFSIEQEAAQAALDQALNSRMERIKGLFINNRVASTRMTPVYLPFWLYDVSLQVNITTQRRSAGMYQDKKLSQAYRHENITDSAFDVPVCGVESPPRSLTDRLARYDLEKLHAYDPELLAGVAAELYTLDFEKSALLARQRISEQMRRRHGHGNREDVSVTVQSIVQTMQFRLVMLPVYVVTVIEKDGDHRSVLVHGQTAQVVLGVAARPKH